MILKLKNCIIQNLRLQEFVVSFHIYISIQFSVFAIGTGCEEIENIKEQTWINEYVVDAELGKEKHENNIIGKVTGEAVYGKQLCKM